MITAIATNTKFVGKLRIPSTTTTQYVKIFATAQIARQNTTASVETEDYQFLQSSKRPTSFYQNSLPHLPIPKLDSSLRKYLQAQKPILTASEFEKTKQHVSKFEGGIGPVLQQKLTQMDKSNPSSNYISPYWFKMYLSDRKPVPINYNPAVVLALEDNPKYNAQLVKATNIVVSSLRFMRSLREDKLDPEVFYMVPEVEKSALFNTMTALVPNRFRSYAAMAFTAFPLDMSQYHNLFCTTRLPHRGMDEIFEDPLARHIVVARKGHIYAFNVLDEEGHIVSPKEIATNLKAILNDNISINDVPLGILTTSDRNEWAKIRSHLEDIGNRDLLRCVDSSIFFMNLDDDIIGENSVDLLRNYLHSDGINRWFDKSLSLIITKDGYAGINFEHSWGDGVAVLRFAKDVKADISAKPQFHPEDVEGLSDNANIIKLDFNVDESIKQAVNTEKRKFNAWRERLGVDFVLYEGFGRDQCKKSKVSPDAIMQLAFQLAMYNLTQTSVPTYESCSTAVFKLGRTETIRPCTMETKATCKAISEGKTTTSMSELKELILKCSKTHTSLMKDAALGQGFDRHLFALKKQSEELNESLPEIFTDPAYDYMNKNILSTSTLSSPAIISGGFGPTAEDGYGLGYMIQDKRLGTTITTYRKDHTASDFAQSLRDAFESINKILTHK